MQAKPRHLFSGPDSNPYISGSQTQACFRITRGTLLLKPGWLGGGGQDQVEWDLLGWLGLESWSSHMLPAFTPLASGLTFGLVQPSGPMSNVGQETEPPEKEAD